MGGVVGRQGGRRYFCQSFAHRPDRKSTRLNSSHSQISYAVFCLKKNTYDVGMGYVGIVIKKERYQMDVDHHRLIAALHIVSQQAIAGLQSATSRQNTTVVVYAHN